MRRASYREAIRWIAVNDDTQWLDDEVAGLCVSAVLVSDLFGVSEEKVARDIRLAVAKQAGAKP